MAAAQNGNAKVTGTSQMSVDLVARDLAHLS
jgi:hypothetical protein